MPFEGPGNKGKGGGGHVNAATEWNLVAECALAGAMQGIPKRL